MSKKKSYMDQKNILNEAGFIDAIRKFFKGKKPDTKTLDSLDKSINKMNDLVAGIEKNLNSTKAKRGAPKVKLPRYNRKDFF